MGGGGRRQNSLEYTARRVSVFRSDFKETLNLGLENFAEPPLGKLNSAIYTACDSTAKAYKILTTYKYLAF